MNHYYVDKLSVVDEKRDVLIFLIGYVAGGISFSKKNEHFTL